MAVRGEKYINGHVAFDLILDDGSVVNCAISDQTLFDMFEAESLQSRHLIGAFHGHRKEIEEYARGNLHQRDAATGVVVLDD